jgi:hypothetical protein
MVRKLVLAAVATCLAAGGCAMSEKKYSADKEWARAECGRIIDDKARERCLRRVDEE